MGRNSLRAVVILAFVGGGCGGSAPLGPGPDSDGGVAAGTYELVAPTFTLGPGQERTVCFYTRLANATAIGVKRFSSSMTAGSHHLILYTTAEATRPDGTLRDCGIIGGVFSTNGTRIPVWVYAAQEPEAELAMPEGVGMKLDPNQPVILQLHYLNASVETIQPSARIEFETLAGDAWVQARPFVTYDTQIQVGPFQTGEAQGDCVVSPTAKFFLMSTHSHRFTTRVRVFDGETLLVDTHDWEHPAVTEWAGEPFYQFQSGALTYHCEYENPTDRTVETGDSAETDEMCMAVGYFFPATGQRFCLDGFVLPF